MKKITINTKKRAFRSAGDDVDDRRCSHRLAMAFGLFTMCAASTKPPASKQMTQILCCVCAIMHMLVVFHAVIALKAALCGELRSDPVRATALLRDALSHGAAAYVVDLVAIVCFGVVPFSRCQPLPEGGLDVFRHHLPVLLVILPLQVPLLLGWETVEPVVRVLAQHDTALGGLLVQQGCWVSLSSVNEAIMCMQRVDLPIVRLWNSRSAYIFEMAYKCLIFTLFYALSAHAGIRIGISATAIASASCDAHRLCVAHSILASPYLWGHLGGCTFGAVLYPGMLSRAFGKLRGILDGSILGTPAGAPSSTPCMKAA
jgi:hypothetical protein